MMWTRVESRVWLIFLFVSICLASAQAQTPAVDQKIEAKVVTDLGRTRGPLGRQARGDEQVGIRITSRIGPRMPH